MNVVVQENSPNMNQDQARMELYALLGEGYRAMQAGEETSLEEVKEQLMKRRLERG